MIVPTDVPITIYRGSAYDEEYEFWTDAANTDPYDFTPWVVSAMLVSAVDSNAVAFSVDVEGGVVTLSLTDEQTTSLNDTVRTTYIMTIVGAEDSPGGPYYIVKGDVTVQDVS